MFCMKCNHDLQDCTCEDINQRLSELSGGGHIVFRMCQICALHYSRCSCENPIWVRSDNGGALEIKHEKPL